MCLSVCTRFVCVITFGGGGGHNTTLHQQHSQFQRPAFGERPLLSSSFSLPSTSSSSSSLSLSAATVVVFVPSTRSWCTSLCWSCTLGNVLPLCVPVPSCAGDTFANAITLIRQKERERRRRNTRSAMCLSHSPPGYDNNHHGDRRLRRGPTTETAVSFGAVLCALSTLLRAHDQRVHSLSLSLFLLPLWVRHSQLHGNHFWWPAAHQCTNCQLTTTTTTARLDTDRQTDSVRVRQRTHAEERGK